MLVFVEMDRHGGVTVEPVSKRIRRKVEKHLALYLPVYSISSEVYWQGEYEVSDTIKNNKQWKEVLRGWGVVMRVDAWEYGHWVGYDTHNVL